MNLGDIWEILEVYYTFCFYCSYFFVSDTIYRKNQDMATGKRQFRDMEDDVKQKISQSLKNRGKSSEHAQKISDSMKRYWKTVPPKPKPSDEESSGVI